MSVGIGMLSVVLPLALTDATMGYGVIAGVLAANGVGSALSAVPAGAAVATVGERRMVVVGMIGLAASMALLATSSDPWTMAALQFAAGAAAVALRVAAQTLVTHTVVAHQRGRALSMLGGIRRFGMFVGPVLGGLAIEGLGFTVSFLLIGALPAAGLVSLALARTEPVEAGLTRREPISIGDALARHWRTLLVVAAGPVLITTVRRGRSVVLPLIADDLDIGPVAVGLVVSIGTGADLLLFPAAGYIMDTFGRLHAIVPAFALMGLGLILLGFATSANEVIAAGAVIGVGNGLSAGSMLTLGSDLAPQDAPAQFMAGFAALQDTGIVIGPLLVGVVAGAVDLGLAAVVLGGLLFVGLGLVGTVTEKGRRAAHAALAK